jgi:osmotically inducible lipoprotein OsmB
MLFMKRLMISTVAIGLLALGGCSGMNTTEQRTLSGGAIGAAAGTVVSVATGGCIICGAAIGAGVGALGGFVYDRMER